MLADATTTFGNQLNEPRMQVIAKQVQLQVRNSHYEHRNVNSLIGREPALECTVRVHVRNILSIRYIAPNILHETGRSVTTSRPKHGIKGEGHVS